ncbi:MAG: hypothetical protein HQK53_11340, partial [Oligoflexia bacterium]|nr:hypothetical protein [Oligoflexia bacterium]
QPLPMAFSAIAEQASKKSSRFDKINTVTSLLADKVRYMGDWRTIKGKYIAHNLHEIEQLQLGDCKDFAVATAAILNSIGFRAEVAMVLRGITAYPMPNQSIVDIAHFNHAIVKVSGTDKESEAGKEKDLWIDPTNFLSMAHDAFPDIQNKMALVLSEKTESLELIPPSPPESAKLNADIVYDLKSREVVLANCNLKLEGLMATFLSGSALNMSKEQISINVISLLEDYATILSKEVTLPDLTSRIVGPLEFSSHYVKKNTESMTNSGRLFMNPINLNILRWLTTIKDQAEDVIIGNATFPATLQLKITVKNIRPTGNKPISCQINSPWIDATIKTKYFANKVEIYEVVKTKKAIISNQEIYTPDYIDTMKKIEKCFLNGQGIVFQ